MKKGMKEIKYLNEIEIEVDGKIYTITKDNAIKEYAGFKWRVLEEQSDGTLLVLDNKLPKEIMEKVFNKNLLDSDGNIKFSYNSDNWRWSDSPIRMGLNSKFLEMLNIDDLVEMKTTTKLNGEIDVTRDYVRIPSKEEYESMDKEIRGMSDPQGSVLKWSLSPFYFDGAYSYVFLVNTSGQLNYNDVSGGGAVAPVIKLKTDVFDRIVGK